MAEQSFSKDPLTSSHGDSLVDQSFQSLKSKEIRDSTSPSHDIKFHSLALNHPNSSGWNVQSTAEATHGGKGYRTETLATTDGIEKLNGGVAEFKGLNEQRSSAYHDGDDKNFVKKASESSNTHLQEHVVIGDENSGRIEKKSTTTSSSSSQFVSSSQTIEGEPLNERFITDGRHRSAFEDHHKEYENSLQEKIQQQRLYDERHLRKVNEQSLAEERRHHLEQQQREEREHRVTEQYNRTQREHSQQKKVETENYQEQTRKVIDMDKASPEYQQHVQYLMSQPGEIISNTVEYPKPNVKMITTVKRLPDGTIVKNKRYETEELKPAASETRRSSTSSTKQTSQQQRHSTTERRVQNEENLQNRLQQTRERSNSPRKPSQVDMVDNADSRKQINEFTDNYGEEVKHSYSSLKKSSHRYATESTSETVEEYNDRSPKSVRRVTKPQDFSTHGFPSVRSDKLTQEYPSEKPHAERPSPVSAPRASPSPGSKIAPQSFPEGKIEKTIGPNGEIIVKVSSETVKNIKQKSSSERIVETEITEKPSGVQGYPSVTAPRQRSKSPDFSTQGFPSVRSPSKPHEGSPRPRSKSPDFSTHGFPSVRSPSKPSKIQERIDEENIHNVSSERTQKSAFRTNTEHIVETERVFDDDYHVPAGKPSARPSQDLSTNGFPSQRSPTKSKPDFSTHGFPSVKTPSQQDGPSPRNQPSASKPPTNVSPKKSTIIETTQRLVQKEKETDAAHRAFAASLRSSSPMDSPRRDSHHSDHHRQTPRSSVSSTKTYSRHGREGSHDSNSPSETSRYSSTTVTRQSPAKSLGKTVLTRPSILKTKQTNGSSETIDINSPRSPKSPSPGKTVTTTTTKITTNVTKKPSTTTSTTTTSSSTVKPGTQ